MTVATMQFDIDLKKAKEDFQRFKRSMESVPLKVTTRGQERIVKVNLWDRFCKRIATQTS